MSNIDIDIVYLWVDGSDPQWRAKKNAALAANGRPVPDYACGEHRFSDHGELKYSLRSLHKFAPWIHHIFIVTDGQRPSWLSNSPRVSIVDHTEFIPHKYLPVFNASAIELFLQNIPGLSEHFLFANDDMFFGAPVEPEFFFDQNGNPIVIVQEKYLRRLWLDDYRKYLARKGMYFNMVKNGNRLVFERFGKKYNITGTHAIEPMRRSYLTDIVNQFENELMTSTTTKFRETGNIARLIFPMTDNVKGRNTLVLEWRFGTERTEYDVNRDSLCKQVGRTLFSTGAGFLRLIHRDSVEQGSTYVLWRWKPKVFCIGDRKPSVPLFVKSLPLMQRMFPDATEWEK